MTKRDSNQANQKFQDMAELTDFLLEEIKSIKNQFELFCC